MNKKKNQSRFIRRGHPSKNPQAYLLAGQPVAGKTKLADI